MRIIKNTSRWETADFRRLIYACAKHYGATIPRLPVVIRSWRGYSPVAAWTWHDGSTNGIEIGIGGPKCFTANIVESLADIDAPYGTLRGPSLEPIIKAVCDVLRVCNADVGAAWLVGNKPGKYPLLPEVTLRPRCRRRLSGDEYQAERIRRAQRLAKEWRAKLKDAKARVKTAETKIQLYEAEIRKRRALLKKRISPDPPKPGEIQGTAAKID